MKNCNAVPAPVCVGLILGVLSAGSAFASPWINTGPLSISRYSHTSTLLLNGQLLVVGGIANNAGTTNNAELYDPLTGSNRTTGPMITPRQSHTATLLLNGKVLVVGGANASQTLGSAELYDPATGNWTSTGALHTPRRLHTATLLLDGRVLVAGGNDMAN